MKKYIIDLFLISIFITLSILITCYGESHYHKINIEVSNNAVILNVYNNDDIKFDFIEMTPQEAALIASQLGQISLTSEDKRLKLLKEIAYDEKDIKTNILVYMDTNKITLKIHEKSDVIYLRKGDALSICSELLIAANCMGYKLPEIE